MEICSDNSIQLKRCSNTSSVAIQTSLVPVANPSTSRMALAGAAVCPLVGDGGGVTVPERLCNFVASFRSTILKNNNYSFNEGINNLRSMEEAILVRESKVKGT